jgi:hypothetical protein
MSPTSNTAALRSAGTETAGAGPVEPFLYCASGAFLRAASSSTPGKRGGKTVTLPEKSMLGVGGSKPILVSARLTRADERAATL